MTAQHALEPSALVSRGAPRLSATAGREADVGTVNEDVQPHGLRNGVP
jgi:hypothetical protein